MPCSRPRATRLGFAAGGVRGGKQAPRAHWLTGGAAASLRECVAGGLTEPSIDHARSKSEIHGLSKTKQSRTCT